MTSPHTNIAWTIPTNDSTIQRLTLKNIAVPTSGPKQVLVKGTAASPNYRDSLIASRSPQYPRNHKTDLVRAADGAGIIHSVGSDTAWSGKDGRDILVHTNDWLNGDVRNMSNPSILGEWNRDGTLQQSLVVDDALVNPTRKSITAVESASFPTAGMTAWKGIREQLESWRRDAEEIDSQHEKSRPYHAAGFTDAKRQSERESGGEYTV
ncbi:hypothetical protein ACN47E_005821 [Coniothyrium glycines]